MSPNSLGSSSGEQRSHELFALVDVQPGELQARAVLLHQSERRARDDCFAAALRGDHQQVRRASLSRERRQPGERVVVGGLNVVDTQDQRALGRDAQEPFAQRGLEQAAALSQILRKRLRLDLAEPFPQRRRQVHEYGGVWCYRLFRQLRARVEQPECERYCNSERLWIGLCVRLQCNGALELRFDHELVQQPSLADAGWPVQKHLAAAPLYCRLNPRGDAFELSLSPHEAPARKIALRSMLVFFRLEPRDGRKIVDHGGRARWPSERIETEQ
jgi:hypothetical protein